jgi:membrane protein YqaA with SNARE-associated domain
MPLATALAVAGATIGMSVNWLIGKSLLKIHQKKKLSVSEYWYNKCSQLFNKYGAILVLFSWLPLMKLMLVAAGFLNVRFRFVLPLIIIGHTIGYGYYLFNH